MHKFFLVFHKKKSYICELFEERIYRFENERLIFKTERIDFTNYLIMRLILSLLRERHWDKMPKTPHSSFISILSLLRERHWDLQRFLYSPDRSTDSFLTARAALRHVAVKLPSCVLADSFLCCEHGIETNNWR